MNTNRIFTSADFMQSTDSDPIRSVITESADACIVAWHIKPGQEIAPHLHPHGQDTWTILAGKGEYYLDTVGTKQPICAGDVVIAPLGCVHGVVNNGAEPLMFISVVSPALAGYQPISFENACVLQV
jgi:quercetin dioxygenase-like cupin family protein